MRIGRMAARALLDATGSSLSPDRLDTLPTGDLFRPTGLPPRLRITTVADTTRA